MIQLTTPILTFVLNSSCTSSGAVYPGDPQQSESEKKEYFRGTGGILSGTVAFVS